jgi:hypothetical protein
MILRERLKKEDNVAEQAALALSLRVWCHVL